MANTRIIETEDKGIVIDNRGVIIYEPRDNLVPSLDTLSKDFRISFPEDEEKHGIIYPRFVRQVHVNKSPVWRNQECFPYTKFHGIYVGRGDVSIELQGGLKREAFEQILTKKLGFKEL